MSQLHKQCPLAAECHLLDMSKACHQPKGSKVYINPNYNLFLNLKEKHVKVKGNGN